MKKQDRLSSRTELAKHFAELGFKTGVEVGVCDGYYSEVLCKNIPDLKLFCVDPWDRNRMYKKMSKDEIGELYYESAKRRLAPYDCTLIKEYSMDAVKNFADETLDFAYIDADHEYKFVKEDIQEWTKKVRIGGIVSGHDYYKTKAGNMGVINAVDEYIKESGYTFNRTAWNIHDDYKDDRQPSWFFIKTHAC